MSSNCWTSIQCKLAWAVFGGLLYHELGKVTSTPRKTRKAGTSQFHLALYDSNYDARKTSTMQSEPSRKVFPGPNDRYSFVSVCLSLENLECPAWLFSVRQSIWRLFLLLVSYSVLPFLLSPRFLPCQFLLWTAFDCIAGFCRTPLYICMMHPFTEQFL